jgi:hypothetical protein
MRDLQSVFNNQQTDWYQPKTFGGQPAGKLTAYRQAILVACNA